MKPHDESEPFFITEKVEAELAAAGYEFEPPFKARRVSDITTSLSNQLAGERCRGVQIPTAIPSGCGGFFHSLRTGNS